MICSEKLMDTELYSMRLVAEATKVNMETCPEEIQAVELIESDAALSDEEKMDKAQNLVSGRQYQKSKLEITQDIAAGTDVLTEQTRNSQFRAETKVGDMYRKLGLGIVCRVLLMTEMCLMVRKLIVKPLVNYNDCIREGSIFPIEGAQELKNLAVTYNQVYEENLETQRLIRHGAEYDALTDLMNRGSFDRVLQIYENGESHYALILVDVDTFKTVNDTYGHAMGDQILKKVAGLLKQMFRSIDFVCRIGGDEFAIVMVDMTSDLAYTIQEKIQDINEELARCEDDLPKVSISVGVAFSDRERAFSRNADKALYRTKENGKCGCSVYWEKVENTVILWLTEALRARYNKSNIDRRTAGSVIGMSIAAPCFANSFSWGAVMKAGFSQGKQQETETDDRYEIIRALGAVYRS